jgi:hypothetical protein
MNKGEIFMFITNKGYTLSALRMDKNTGKVLERIDYF